MLFFIVVIEKDHFFCAFIGGLRFLML